MSSKSIQARTQYTHNFALGFGRTRNSAITQLIFRRLCSVQCISVICELPLLFSAKLWSLHVFPHCLTLSTHKPLNKVVMQYSEQINITTKCKTAESMKVESMSAIECVTVKINTCCSSGSLFLFCNQLLAPFS